MFPRFKRKYIINYTINFIFFRMKDNIFNNDKNKIIKIIKNK